MNIALDMMGGDFAPLEAVKGVELFLPKLQQGVSLLLIGDEEKLNNNNNKNFDDHSLPS